MAKVKQTNFSLDEQSLSKLEIIKKITLLDNSKVARLAIEKLYESLKKNKYDLNKLEL